MTARVLNPAVFTEFYKIRSPTTVRKARDFSSQKLERIKRDLFGPINSIETKKLFEHEIQKQQENACKKWGFDFRSGQPLTDKSQFIWERVAFPDIMPAMYTLSRAAHIREINAADQSSEEDSLMDERADRENANSSMELSDDEIFKVPIANCILSTSQSSPISCKTSLGKRQPKITEYMKERKRLSATPKKHSPPLKRLRSNSGSSSSHHGHAALFSSQTGRLHFRQN